VAAEAERSSTFWETFWETRCAGARPPDTVLRRLGLALAAALLATLGIAPGARAAQLVEIRVGVHPGFTRVVFELDSEAGYSVARPTAESASDELVVDLAAASCTNAVIARLKELLGAHPGSTPVQVRFISSHGTTPIEVGTHRVEPAAGLLSELRHLGA